MSFTLISQNKVQYNQNFLTNETVLCRPLRLVGENVRHTCKPTNTVKRVHCDVSFLQEGWMS